MSIFQLEPTTDMPCAACGYNLRNLSVAGKCPECGLPIERTLEIPGDDPAKARLQHQLRHSRIAAAMHGSGNSEECISFVLDIAEYHASRCHALSLEPPASTRDWAAQFAFSFFEFLAQHFTAWKEARGELVRLNLGTDTDIWRVIRALQDCGAIKAPAPIPEEDFAAALKTIHIAKTDRGFWPFTDDQYPPPNPQ